MAYQVMLQLSPEAGAGIGAGVGNNPDLVVALLNQLDPSILVDAINANPSLAGTLSSNLSPRPAGPSRPA